MKGAHISAPALDGRASLDHGELFAERGGWRGPSGIVGLELVDRGTRVTLLGLGLAVMACVAAIRGQLELALVLLIGSGCCDVFDGPIARGTPRTERVRSFGAAMDTIADMASFGVTPVVLVVSTHVGWMPIAAVALYSICAALRLAYFTVTDGTSRGGSPGYWGVPVTYSALVLPVAFMLADTTQRGVTVPLVLAGLGLLFVVPVRVPKPTRRGYAVLVVMAIALSGFWIMRWLAG